MERIIAQLDKNKTVFYDLLKNETDAMILWKQTPEKWDLLHIVCHLYDEERDDFRFRVKWVLEKPNTIPPPFNPIDWVTEHNYKMQDYNKKLEAFLIEREHSVAWLKTLTNPNWDNAFDHPKLGTLTAKSFLVNWLAHDYLHIRQILKLKFDFIKEQSGESLSYAGLW